MSRSRTTTKGHAAPRTARLVERRLPRHLPPTHPGEMLLEEFLKPLAISQSAFAIRLGVSFPRLNEIIRGKRSVTPDTALRLARVLGMSADFWLGLQQDWDLWHAMHGKEATAIEQLVPLPLAAVAEIQRQSVQRGKNTITPAEIDAEIASVRRTRSALNRLR